MLVVEKKGFGKQILKKILKEKPFFRRGNLNLEKETCVARECSKPLLMIGSLTAPLNISREAGLFC